MINVYRAAAAAGGATTLQYIVLVGGDYEIPFFRFPDVAGLASENEYVPPVADSSASQASLQNAQILNQDAYGAQFSVTRSGYSLPLPQLAVGRLVRTAAQITGVIDAYLNAGGVVAPASSLVTGYDFVADAANAVQGELTQAFAGASNARQSTLIQPQANGLTGAWGTAQLRPLLLNQRNDLVFFAGHFSAGSLIAADYAMDQQMQAGELLTAPASLSNTLVLALGCHSGYNIPAPDATAGSPAPDWAEAFASRGATYVAATGYAYGDTDLTGYGERLYLDLVQQLRTGAGPIALGTALVKSKREYLSNTPAPVGIGDKTQLQTTPDGLPTRRGNLP